MDTIAIKTATNTFSDENAETITNTSTTREDSSLQGESCYNRCPECGNPILDFDDRIACSQAEAGGCIFTITVEEFQDILYANLDKVVVNEFTCCGENTLDNLKGLAFTMGKSAISCHELDHTCFGYFEMQIAKDKDGKWGVEITQDNEGLAAIANRNLELKYKEEGLS